MFWVRALSNAGKAKSDVYARGVLDTPPPFFFLFFFGWSDGVGGISGTTWEGSTLFFWVVITFIIEKRNEKGSGGWGERKTKKIRRL